MVIFRWEEAALSLVGPESSAVVLTDEEFRPLGLQNPSFADNCFLFFFK